MPCAHTNKNKSKCSLQNLTNRNLGLKISTITLKLEELPPKIQQRKSSDTPKNQNSTKSECSKTQKNASEGFLAIRVEYGRPKIYGPIVSAIVPTKAIFVDFTPKIEDLKESKNVQH